MTRSTNAKATPPLSPPYIMTNCSSQPSFLIRNLAVGAGVGEGVEERREEKKEDLAPVSDGGEYEDAQDPEEEAASDGGDDEPPVPLVVLLQEGCPHMSSILDTVFTPSAPHPAPAPSPAPAATCRVKTPRKRKIIISAQLAIM